MFAFSKAQTRLLTMGGTASRGEKSSSSSSSSASASASSPGAARPRSSSLRVKPLSSSLQRCLPFVCFCPNGVCTKPKNIRRDTASSSSPLRQARYVSAGDETGALVVVGGGDHTPAADLNAALAQRKRLKGNFKKKYALSKVLGSGAFGQVRKGKSFKQQSKPTALSLPTTNILHSLTPHQHIPLER